MRNPPLADGTADGSRTVLVRVRAALPGLRPSERRIAEALLDNPSGAAARTVAELAGYCRTSTTTVVRFYQRIGYRRFKDLRIDLTREVTREQLETASTPPVSGDIDRNDSVDDIIAKVAANESLSIADTAEILDREALTRAVNTVLSARRVDAFGVAAGGLVALDLQQKLTRIGRTALSWQDTDAALAAAATLDGDCAVVAISHSGETAATVEFQRLAAESGAATIALTNHGDSALARAADLVLTTAARETRFRSGALGSRIAQLMVVDCLFTGVARESYDDSMAALRKTYAAVHREPRLPRPSSSARPWTSWRPTPSPWRSERFDNLARMVFADPAGRGFYREWDRTAHSCVAEIRAGYGHDPGSARIGEVVADLSARSGGFARIWATHEVKSKSQEDKHLRHPQVGDLDFEFAAFTVNGPRTSNSWSTGPNRRVRRRRGSKPCGAWPTRRPRRRP